MRGINEGRRYFGVIFAKIAKIMTKLISMTSVLKIYLSFTGQKKKHEDSKSFDIFLKINQLQKHKRSNFKSSHYYDDLY
jgi:hypothetical protein